jgi:hypothetical protein
VVHPRQPKPTLAQPGDHRVGKNCPAYSSMKEHST